MKSVEKNQHNKQSLSNTERYVIYLVIFNLKNDSKQANWSQFKTSLLSIN